MLLFKAIRIYDFNYIFHSVSEALKVGKKKLKIKDIEIIVESYSLGSDSNLRIFLFKCMYVQLIS